MKLWLSACLLFLSVQHSYAQITTGKITFTETRKFNFSLGTSDIKADGVSADQVNQIAAMIPKEQAFKKELLFSPDAALYQPVKTENSDATSQQGNMQIMMHIAGDEGKSYRDIKNNKLIEQEEFMSRKFLINSDIRKTEWKMTGTQKAILGYPCQQATTMKDTSKVIAWFTSAIPVPAGPQGMGGLPGMILAMDIGDDLNIVATKIEKVNIDNTQMIKPTDGKKVTREQYKTMVDKKMKEMEAQYGSGDNIIIQTDIRH